MSTRSRSNITILYLRVNTIREMSTEVDVKVRRKNEDVETVKKMSTGVDSIQ